MSTPAPDLPRVQEAYSRVSEKFKVTWTFHQFLQGLHKSLWGQEPTAPVGFVPLYEQLKKVKETKAAAPSEESLSALEKIDGQLEAIRAALIADDRRVPPHAVRRFVESVGEEDEKLLLSLLKFYFLAPKLSPDELDKVDFLFTRLGTRKGEDGIPRPRDPKELQQLSSALLSLTRHKPRDPDEVRTVLALLKVLREDIDTCRRFEDLIRRQPLENIRTLKHRLGDTFYSSEVLNAILDANVAARNKFRKLYEEEEVRILESSRQLLAMEKEMEQDPRFASDEFQAELRRFKREREEFERQSRRRGVRSRDVRRLKESMHRILRRIDPSKVERDAVGDSSTAPGRRRPAVRREARRTPTGEWPAMLPGGFPAWLAEADPLTSEAAGRIRRACDLFRSGEPEGASAASVEIRLEPWEVRATVRVFRRWGEQTEPLKAEERVLFNAAALRLRMDEEARTLRVLLEELGEQSASEETLAPSGKCLARAQEIDRHFRRLIQTSSGAARGELTRSRFRHVRAFAGLWLLYNALGGR